VDIAFPFLKALSFDHPYNHHPIITKSYQKSVSYPLL
jgi:hypothetical protein